MIFTTIQELSRDKFNRYEIALATAKCARLVTDEYVHQRNAAEQAQTGNKETDKPINTMIDRDLRDEKAVKIAIGRLADGEYVITDMSLEDQEKQEREVLEGPNAGLNPDDAREEDEDLTADEEESETEAEKDFGEEVEEVAGEEAEETANEDAEDAPADAE